MLQGKKKHDIPRLDVVQIARVPKHASKLVFFLVGLRTYQHPSTVIYDSLDIGYTVYFFQSRKFLVASRLFCIIAGLRETIMYCRAKGEVKPVIVQVLRAPEI